MLADGTPAGIAEELGEEPAPIDFAGTEEVGVAIPVVAGAGAAAPEILASRLCTGVWGSTSCWLGLPRRDLISSRLSESPWTCVDMVSRRAPELAWTSWTDFWSEPMVAASLLTLSLDWPTRVLMTASCWVSLSERSFWPVRREVTSC